MKHQPEKTPPLSLALSFALAFPLGVLVVFVFGVVKTLVASSQTPSQSVEKRLESLTSAADEKLGQRTARHEGGRALTRNGAH